MSSSRFDASSVLKMLIPVMLAPGRERLVTKPSCTGSVLTKKTIGIVVVAAFAANEDGGPDVTITATAHQVHRQRRQTVIVIFGPSVCDPHVLAIDITGLLKALSKSTQPSRHYV